MKRRARRELLGLAAAKAPPVHPETGLPMRGGGPEVYTRLGGKPYINCTAITTIHGGSAQRPEVIEAVRQAAYYHVNLDELMTAVARESPSCSTLKQRMSAQRRRAPLRVRLSPASRAAIRKRFSRCLTRVG